MPSLADVQWPKHTKRLTLRPAVPTDIDATFAIRSAPGVSEWLPYLVEDRGVWAAKFMEPDRISKTVVIERDGDLIGDLMIHVQDAWAQTEVAEQAAGVQAELGYSLRPDASGQGYATEAVEEAIRICFEDLGLHRVFAQAFAENEASWRLMERVGMRREALNVADSLHRDGTWRDGVFYALLADEWRARIS